MKHWVALDWGTSNFRAYLMENNNVIDQVSTQEGMKFVDQKEFENTLVKNTTGWRKKFNINIVCLAGFMRILTPLFLKKVKIPVINIHPSLLPRLKGLNTHSRAIKAKHKYSGCTVHFVNDKLDSGKIITQKKIKILKRDNPETLAKKILKLEYKAYIEALEKII